MNRCFVTRRPTRSCVQLLLALAACCPLPLTAQSSNFDVLRDSQRALMDAAIGTDRTAVVSRTAYVDREAFTLSPAQEKAKKTETKEAAEAAADLLKYSFSVLGAGDFNSNANAMPTRGTESVEGDPQLRLGLSKRFSSPEYQSALQLSGLLAGSSDRFVRLPTGDSDSLYADVRVQAVNKDDDQAFAPFLDYSPSLGFAPTFTAHNSTSQSLSLGFDKSFNFTSKWGCVPHQPDTSNATNWSIGVTGTLTRRFIESSPSLLLITAQPSLSYSSYDSETGIGANMQWNASLALVVSRRLHDQSEGFSQRDWVVEPILTAVLTPPQSWFSSEPAPDVEFDSYKHWGMPKLLLQAAYLQVNSNLATAQFHQLSIGPTIKLAWGS